ncbi:endonuclease/exonuclease/phosphatase family protein [Amphritea sp. 1_MG-2023]|uniref:endonuclease/exonuclease/phosphatase family protein n=1 Tax=Amphritea sp. 1_MG-2023 TaxID=3062670 RepID=UPI0026E268D8|nr:endonuclease/exonuclease/phosphatase family protein [Amphritea sp. 1_MG-2023]MDO6561831.1 endonuclease/exonuclease/phosphatase family protein [Amphritea sp. 1_MG-2023]
MDFPRLQIAVIAAVLLLADLIFLDLQALIAWALISATTLCLLWQLWWILPYTPCWPKEVKTATESSQERQISILTSNVLTPNRNADALIKLIQQHQPDILVTLESDQWWEDQLNALDTDMPFSVKCPLDNLYGMHVYSKLPLEEPEICYLVEQDVPSIHASVVLKTGDKVRVHFIHPAPPSPTENPESAERDAELIVVAKSVVDSDQPIIVTGDLNDVAWSATTRLFRKISGLLDPRVGRGIYNTFHVDYPFLRWPLDHLFHSRHFVLISIQRLPSIGSDHFSLFTKLLFMPQHGEDQAGLEADDADHEWSEEIVEKQNVSQHDVPEPGR